MIKGEGIFYTNTKPLLMNGIKNERRTMKGLHCASHEPVFAG
jgi:hypothetical protein